MSSGSEIEKAREPEKLKQKVKYASALGLMGVALLAMGFPLFLVIFLGVFGFLLWKIFTFSPVPLTRDVYEVFEFYLAAHEILRDNKKHWFGFEIKEAIAKGEQLISFFPDFAPPLLYFTVGALYYKIGNYKLAEDYLTKVVEKQEFNEISCLKPSEEIRIYTKILRKIENNPSEAPLTVSAIEALEKLRRNRAGKLLKEARKKVEEMAKAEELNETKLLEQDKKAAETPKLLQASVKEANSNVPEVGRPRKPISELLHDIYDES